MSNALEIVAKRPVLNHTLTVYGNAEDPLFLAKDVAEWIEHSDTSTMLRNIDDEEKVSITNPNNVCGGQSAWFLTESGLYEVLMLSRKPIAKQFKKEVKKILHELRTKGKVTMTAVQEELPLLPSDEVLTTVRQLSLSMGLTPFQVHGIVSRHRKALQAGKDFFHNGKFYFTASGVEKIKRFASITNFRHISSGISEDKDLICQEMKKRGYSEAMYLTFLLLMNWYELDERKMFEVVKILNTANGTQLRNIPDAATGLVAIAGSIGNVEKAAKEISTLLRDLLTANINRQEEKRDTILRLTEAAYQELTAPPRPRIAFRSATIQQ